MSDGSIKPEISIAEQAVLAAINLATEKGHDCALCEIDQLLELLELVNQARGIKLAATALLLTQNGAPSHRIVSPD